MCKHELQSHPSSVVHMISFNLTLEDYWSAVLKKVDTIRCSSDLDMVLLNTLTEDWLQLRYGIKFERAKLSPSKRRSPDAHSPGDLNRRLLKTGSIDLSKYLNFKLDDVARQQLTFLSLCVERWLGKSDRCFGVPLPETVSIFQSNNSWLE